MTYTEAVELAKKGKQRGFVFLYQCTYESKLYLALQYMKNTEDAKNILRDSYIKAFSSLDTLQNPERFSVWFGQILANTVKITFVKKNPVLFSDMASETNNEPFEFRIEDYNFSRQPEISYTKEETRLMVNEMLDSLSPEQRVCILMFHFEGASVKEIASALNCSENTVKSRINCGKKNIKLKTEALQKKGFKLYGWAPLTLLAALLRKDANAMYSEPAFNAAADEIAKKLFKNTNISGKGIKSADLIAAKDVVNKGIEKIFSGSAAGRIIIGIIVGAAVIAGAAVGAVQLIRNGADTVSQEEAAAEVSAEPEISAAAEIPVEPEINDTAAEAEEETFKPAAVADDDYPSLIKGALTKKEIELVLAYGPAWSSGEMKKEDLTDEDYRSIVNAFGQVCDYEGSEYYGLLTNGMDSRYHRWHLKDEINRLFSSFTDFQFSESSTVPGIEADSMYVWDWPAELNFSSSASITEAVYFDNEIIIYFDYYKQKLDGAREEITDGKKAAVLRKTDNGTFQIVLITNASEVDPEEEFGLNSAGESEDNSDISDTGETAGVRQLYEQVLNNAGAGKYTFPDAAVFIESSGYFTPYYYFVEDIDADGTAELGVGKLYFEEEPNGYEFSYYDTLIFDAEGGSLKQIDGHISLESAFVAPDGKGFYGVEYYYGRSDYMELSTVTIDSGAIVTSGKTEYYYPKASEFRNARRNAGEEIEWFEYTDLSGLAQLN